MASRLLVKKFMSGLLIAITALSSACAINAQEPSFEPEGKQPSRVRVPLEGSAKQSYIDPEDFADFRGRIDEALQDSDVGLNPSFYGDIFFFMPKARQTKLDLDTVEYVIPEANVSGLRELFCSRRAITRADRIYCGMEGATATTGEGQEDAKLPSANPPGLSSLAEYLGEITVSIASLPVEGADLPIRDFDTVGLKPAWSESDEKIWYGNNPQDIPVYRQPWRAKRQTVEKLVKAELTRQRYWSEGRVHVADCSGADLIDPSEFVASFERGATTFMPAASLTCDVGATFEQTGETALETFNVLARATWRRVDDGYLLSTVVEVRSKLKRAGPQPYWPVDPERNVRFHEVSKLICGDAPCEERIQGDWPDSTDSPQLSEFGRIDCTRSNSEFRAESLRANLVQAYAAMYYAVPDVLAGSKVSVERSKEGVAEGGSGDGVFRAWAVPEAQKLIFGYADDKCFDGSNNATLSTHEQSHLLIPELRSGVGLGLGLSDLMHDFADAVAMTLTGEKCFNRAIKKDQFDPPYEPEPRCFGDHTTKLVDFEDALMVPRLRGRANEYARGQVIAFLLSMMEKRIYSAQGIEGRIRHWTRAIRAMTLTAFAPIRGAGPDGDFYRALQQFLRTYLLQMIEADDEWLIPDLVHMWNENGISLLPIQCMDDRLDTFEPNHCLNGEENLSLSVMYLGMEDQETLSFGIKTRTNISFSPSWRMMIPAEDVSCDFGRMTLRLKRADKEIFVDIAPLQRSRFIQQSKGKLPLGKRSFLQRDGMSCNAKIEVPLEFWESISDGKGPVQYWLCLGEGWQCERRSDDIPTLQKVKPSVFEI